MLYLPTKGKICQFMCTKLGQFSVQYFSPYHTLFYGCSFQFLIYVFILLLLPYQQETKFSHPVDLTWDKNIKPITINARLDFTKNFITTTD